MRVVDRYYDWLAFDDEELAIRTARNLRRVTGDYCAVERYGCLCRVVRADWGGKEAQQW
jgi:hypothetical protein